MLTVKLYHGCLIKRMQIHSMWYLCLCIRISIVILLRCLMHGKKIKRRLVVTRIITCALLAIGVGFAYKSVTGSNDEYQLQKVFWHHTRFVHSILYTSAAFVALYGSSNTVSILLSADMSFSVLYRILFDK